MTILDAEKSSAEKMPTKKKPFYGDLVCAVAFIAVTPIDGMKAMRTCQREPEMCHIGLVSIVFCILYGGLNWLAYLKHSHAISFAAFLMGLLLCGFNNFHAWPYPGEFVLVPEFQGMLIGSLVNGELPYWNQMIRFALLFAVATYVSIMSPNSVFHQDVLPLLGGPILLSVIFLSWDRFEFTKSNINWNAVTVHGARYLLAAIFMHHTACELLSLMYSQDNSRLVIETVQKSNAAIDTIRTIVKASFFACVGVAATGTFQNEINLNEKLESLVQERTKEIMEKNDRLYMVELALHASETAIAITDSNKKIIWLNGACEEITSLAKVASSSEEKLSPVGKQLVEVLELKTELDEKKLANAFSDTRTEDEMQIQKMIYRIEVSPYAYSSTTASNGQSKNKSNENRFMVVLKNITAERAREVAEKAAGEEAMLAKAMGESMVTLTHELRTPMQGIMGVTGMLIQEHTSENEQDDSNLVGSLKLIMASSGLLLNLINNLLDVKKFDSEMMGDLPLSPVVARSAIQDTIDFCKPLASISGVEVVTNYGQFEMMNYQVVSNALRLQQILINLVSNAIKYTSEKSEIRISIQPTIKADLDSIIDNSLASSRENSGNNTSSDETISSSSPVLCFSISDCGPGIPPKEANKLFRRFSRLDQNPTRALGGDNKIGQPSGTGLGLNLCQSFVQQMNGEIWVNNNRDGKGSKFSFYLPLAAESITSSAITPASLTKASSTGSFQQVVSIATSQIRVLLVDDVLINRKVIGRMVKKVGVSDIVTVDSGANALREISENGPYDLVISDLQMPEMSGSELCNAIMADKSSPDMQKPVVVGLTADTSIKVAQECKECGMSTVMYKPISVIEMREFFETVVPQLEPGVWFPDRENGGVLSAQ